MLSSITLIDNINMPKWHLARSIKILPNLLYKNSIKCELFEYTFYSSLDTTHKWLCYWNYTGYIPYPTSWQHSLYKTVWHHTE